MRRGARPQRDERPDEPADVMGDLRGTEPQRAPVVHGRVLRRLRARPVAVAVVEPQLIAERALLEVNDLELLRVDDRPAGALDAIQQIGLLRRVEARARAEVLVEKADSVERGAAHRHVRPGPEPERVAGPAVDVGRHAGQVVARVRAHGPAHGAGVGMLLEECGAPRRTRRARPPRRRRRTPGSRRSSRGPRCCERARGPARSGRSGHPRAPRAAPASRRGRSGRRRRPPSP